MSSLFGTQLEEDYIQVGTTKLPLPRSPESGGSEYDSLRTTPLEPFQAASVLGDDSLVSDGRIGQAVFSDFVAGIGKRRYTEIDNLSGYADGDLDTNDQGYATLPRLPVAISVSGGALSAANRTPAGANRMITGFGYDNNIASGLIYSHAIWEPDTTLPDVYDRTLPGYRTGTGLVGGGWLPLAGMAYFAGLYVCVTNNLGVYTSTNGFNFTPRWNPGGTLQPRGLVVHDNKLYLVVYDTAAAAQSIQLYWVATQAQLTAGTAWPASSTDKFPLEPNETVIDIKDWKDKLDNRQIFIVTNLRIVAYDDADFFTVFAPLYQYDATVRPAAAVFARDDLLYQNYGGLNKSVKVYNHQVIDDVGPWRDGGFTAGAVGDFSIVQMFSNSRWLFAYCRSKNASGAGRILRGNDSFGWSTVNRATQADTSDFNSAVTDNLTGGFLFGDYLYSVYASGAVQRQFFPDRGDLAPYNTDYTYKTGVRWLYSAEFDAGDETLWKLAKWWRVIIENLAGAYTLNQAAAHIYLKWSLDGGAFGTATDLPFGSVFPNVIPLPSLADQSGLAFRKLRFAVGIDGGAATVGDPPLLRAIVLGFTKEPTIYDGLQVPVDLSDDRWANLDLFYGNDREALRTYLETLKNGPGTARKHYPVTIGWAGYQKVYASMDVRVAGSEDPQSRYGKYILTMRDLTAEPSG